MSSTMNIQERVCLPFSLSPDQVETSVYYLLYVFISIYIQVIIAGDIGIYLYIYLYV